jgi:hypothetical protein
MISPSIQWTTDQLGAGRYQPPVGLLAHPEGFYGLASARAA